MTVFKFTTKFAAEFIDINRVEIEIILPADQVLLNAEEVEDKDLGRLGTWLWEHLERQQSEL